MGGLFGGKSKAPEVKATAPAPKVGDQDAAGKVEERKKQRQGIASNILSGSSSNNNSTTKSLLGG